MGDQFNVEEIMAEEEEVGFFQSIIPTGVAFVSAYGWFLLAFGIGLYFLWKNYGHHYQNRTGATEGPSMSPKELAEFQSKEEARQKYVARIQAQYEKEAAVRAEKTKQMEEEKRKARLAELERLTGNNDSNGQRLGTDEPLPSTSSSSGGQPKPKPKSSSFRPEYNPLMGDTTGSSRPCARTGRSGG